MLNRAEGLHPAIASVADDGTGSLSALLQGQQADLVGIGKAGLLAADGAYADALVDMVRAIFNDVIF